MNIGAITHDLVAIGLGASIGSSLASGNVGAALTASVVSVLFVIARAIENHYVNQIEKNKSN